jgi:formate hydrogenlyase subunit 6/NADH:ubiquinone oxidoreductase subunit I
MPASLSRRGFLFGRTFDARVEIRAPSAEIGRACLARHDVSCQLCRDACDAGAIRFSYASGRVPLPLVDFDRCTGCGECVPVCPVNAIVVGTGESA